MATKTTFLQIPEGMPFKFAGDCRYFFRRQEMAFTWSTDGNSKIWKDFVLASEPVTYQFGEPQEHRDAA